MSEINKCNEQGESPRLEPMEVRRVEAEPETRKESNKVMHRRSENSTK